MLNKLAMSQVMKGGYAPLWLSTYALQTGGGKPPFQTASLTNRILNL